MPRITRHAFAAAAATTVVLGFAAPALADSMLAVTTSNRIFAFDSKAPSGITTPVQISNLQPGETVVGLDARPATKQLFALGSTSRIYTLNPISGVATPLTGTAFAPALVSLNAGFNFNPITDRMRVVNDARQNLRINPVNQAVTVDGQLAYAPGDPGVGTNPAVTGAAYTNAWGAVPPATTSLYDIDTARDVLVRQNPENAGTLTTVGPLGIDVSGRVPFDVGTGNVAFAALIPQGQTRASLYTVNLGTGQASPATTTAQAARIGTSVGLTAIASNGPAGTDDNDPTVVVANPNVKRISLVRSEGVAYTVACNEACVVSGDLRRGGTSIGTASSFVEQPGRVAIKITLTVGGLRVMRNVTGGTLSLKTTTQDLAGNFSTVTRIITLTQ